MIKNKLPVVSLIFYILAGLFLTFAVWAAVFSFQYISSMASMGQIVISDNLFEVVSFHMANFGQYVVFAALLFGAGWIVNLFAGVEVETYDYADEELESMEELMDDLETELDEE